MSKSLSTSGKVRDLRKEKKLTQDELAEQLGVSRQSIISVEKGQCLPSLPLALQIADFFGQTIEEIFNEERGEKMMADLMPWSPFGELENIHRQIDRIFQDSFGSDRPHITGGNKVPAVNIREKGQNIIVETDLPGVKEEDCQIEVGHNWLTLKGERKHEEEVKDKDWYHAESSYGAFNRTIGLPQEVMAEKAQAQMKNGTLTIILPKVAKPKKTKKIQIKPVQK